MTRTPGAAWRRLTAIGRELAGGPDARHFLRSRIVGRLRRDAWRRRRQALHRARPPRELVLVGLVEHFGDIVAAEPIIRQLRREHPTGHLAFVVGRRYQELVAHHPDLDEIVAVDCLSDWIHLAAADVCDRVVDLHFQWRRCPRCDLPHVRADEAHGVTFDNYYALGNLLHGYCRAGGVRELTDGPRLHLPPSVRADVDRLALPHRYVAVHCASNEPARDWTAGGWRSVADALLDRGIAVVEVGLRPVVASGREGYVDLCGRLALLQTAEVIRRARLFVGIDSGPAHAANAMGTYGVIVLGAYGPYRRYLPYSGDYATGRNATLLHADGPAAATDPAAVLSAVWSALEARPGERAADEVRDAATAGGGAA